MWSGTNGPILSGGGLQTAKIRVNGPSLRSSVLGECVMLEQLGIGAASRVEPVVIYRDISLLECDIRFTGFR